MKHSFLFLIILILIISIRIKYNTSINRIFHQDLLNFDYDNFYITNKQDYYNKIELGKKEIKNEKIIICSCVRDVEKNIKHLEDNINRLGNMFKDYRCLIVENDSSDKTRQLLLELSRRNPKVVILGCGVNSNTCKLDLPKTTFKLYVDNKRMHKMATIRNIYLDYIKTNKDVFKDYKYMCVWDLDIYGALYNKGIQNSFGHFVSEPNISSISANAYYKFGPVTLYYDTFAHHDLNYNFHSKYFLVHHLRTVVNNFYHAGEPLKDVKSAFSGFTIYKLKDVLDSGARYDYSRDENVMCEHVYFHQMLPNRITMNPSMNFYLLENDV